MTSMAQEKQETKWTPGSWYIRGPEDNFGYHLEIRSEPEGLFTS